MSDVTRETDMPKNRTEVRLLTYITGFVLSLLLTITAYVSVVNQGFRAMF